MNNRLRILSFVVMTYMLAALCWWAVLLQRKNADVFRLEGQLLQQKYTNDLGIPTIDVTTLDEYTEIQEKFGRQQKMILGESLVFGLVLIIGIYFINRAFNKELASAQKQKNFLLSITHELKSPLASINLILETFRKRDLPSDKIKEYSGDALQESQRLDGLFNKILLATRLDTEQTLHFQKGNLSELTSNFVDKFARLHPDVDISHNIDSGILKEMDENAIESVLSNLMENAVKYSPKAAKIIVGLSSTDGKSTELTVEDNGIGIPPKERNAVLEQFYRVGSEETRSSKGTGLGLYIVDKIVKAHRGKISIGNSSLGGALIKVSF